MHHIWYNRRVACVTHSLHCYRNYLHSTFFYKELEAWLEDNSIAARNVNLTYIAVSYNAGDYPRRARKRGRLEGPSRERGLA